MDLCLKVFLQKTGAESNTGNASPGHEENPAGKAGKRAAVCPQPHALPVPFSGGDFPTESGITTALSEETHAAERFFGKWPYFL